MILKWSAEGGGRNEKHREQWMTGVRSIISNYLTEEDAENREL